MKRITFWILALALALTVIAVLRHSRSDDVVSSASPLPKLPRDRGIKVAGGSEARGSHSQNSTSLPASQRMISTAGKEIRLEIYADRTFQLHLPEDMNGIFVSRGQKLFTSENDRPGEVPDGVAIKIRNGAGEIFTVVHGMSNGTIGEGWYRPVLEPNRIRMPVFSTRRVAMAETAPLVSEPPKLDLSAPAERMSPRVKLSALIARLPRNIRNQSGLEFKLSIEPVDLLSAYDMKGARLNSQDFPRHETGWLNGDLLFDDE
jgi:hypothetical protein